jgi:chemotaxis protein MotA
MDPATIVGVLLAFGALYGMMTIEGVNVTSIILPAPMVLVFFATIAVGIASNTIPDAIRAFKSIPRAFTGKLKKPSVVIDQMVGIAEIARRDGLLALEQESEKLDDPFLKMALQNMADGTDAEDLRTLLEDEITTRDTAARTSGKFFMTLGGYAPTIGIIGTVVSLTHVLENLSSPAELGPSIAAAFVATLWGLLSANFIWLPIGTRLIRLCDLEEQRMTLQMEGVLAVQAGSQPRVLGERLRALVPAHTLPKQQKLPKAA